MRGLGETIPHRVVFVIEEFDAVEACLDQSIQRVIDVVDRRRGPHRRGRRCGGGCGRIRRRQRGRVGYGMSACVGGGQVQERDGRYVWHSYKD